MSFDNKKFRKALGRFPTGVTVITTKKSNGEKVGVTASSFNSVSIDPALILWSIDKSAYSANDFTNCEYFTVHVLRDDQIELSNRFSRKGYDKFSDVKLLDEAYRAPRLHESAAWFECQSWNVYDGGDHYIIVGEVKDYGFDDVSSSLVFHDGRYAIADIHPTLQCQ